MDKQNRVEGVIINPSRVRKSYKNIPIDSYNPYRDCRADIFSYNCLYPDKLEPSKLHSKVYLRNKNKKSNYKF